MIFSYDKYRDLLVHLKATAEVVGLDEWDGSNSIILRHDVDLDIVAAYELAKIEAEYDIGATYFFMMTSPTYNIYSKRVRNTLSNIVDLGAEIGLHFDPTMYIYDSESGLERHVEREVDQLADASGYEIKSVSLHNPSLLGFRPIFAKFNNAYDKRIFADDRYISDSRMIFNEKNIYDFVKGVADHPVQILLHPMHYSNEPVDYPMIMAKHEEMYVEQLNNLFNLNETYSKQLGDSSLLSRVLSILSSRQ